MGKMKDSDKHDGGSDNTPNIETPTTSPIPLVDMTQDEYDDLCQQIQTLTAEEIQLEWMESCRYGEIDVVRALAETTRTMTTTTTTTTQSEPSSRTGGGGGDDDDDDISNNNNSNNIDLIHYSQAESGNTGLHMACANNHLTVVRYLIGQLRHPFVTNNAGNTPLHWAASNGAVDVVQYLTSLTSPDVDIDVLAKNSAGRSALTEGFTSQKEEVVKALLEHDSASEEKLLSAGVPVDVDEGDQDGGGRTTTDGNDGDQNVHETLASHVHHFFATDDDNNNKHNHNNDDDNKNNSRQPNPQRESLLKIRELAMKNADNPFADDERPDQDTTGLSIWSASLVCAQWMIDLSRQGRFVTHTHDVSTAATENEDEHKKDQNDESITNDYWMALELGSGCGVPGLALAASLLQQQEDEANRKKRKFFVTDLNPQTVDNLKHNIVLNNLSQHVDTTVMDWSNPETWPPSPCDHDGDVSPPSSTGGTHATYDVVVGSDLIYQKSLVPLLKSVIERTVKPGGIFYYVCPDTGRDGLNEFITEMKTLCPKWKERVAPKEYHQNPLANGDDEECFMHFQELYQKTYVLYEFPF